MCGTTYTIDASAATPPMAQPASRRVALWIVAPALLSATITQGGMAVWRAYQPTAGVACGFRGRRARATPGGRRRGRAARGGGGEPAGPSGILAGSAGTGWTPP